MPANYILLERIELNASAASVTFSNIPQSGYTDLKIVMSLRSTDTSSNSGYYDALLTRFNNSTSNYSGREIYAYQNTPYSGTLTTATSTIAGGTWGRLTGVGVNNSNSSATASTFTSIDLYLPNYTSSNYKSYSLDLAEEQNASYSTLGMTAGLWSDTTAISTIAFALKDGSFTQYSTFSLYGLAAVGTTPAIAPKATGGNITTDGTYWIHTFLATDTFTPQTTLTCDYLVVAGGGGGGYDIGGGGGAGGYLTSIGGSALSVTAQAYTITVGAGGAGGTANRGGNGTNSTFSTITATGGGGGGSRTATYKTGSNGGSAGGGSGDGGTGGTASPTGQGNNGGSGNALYSPGGGGGGAGAVGGNTTSENTAPSGGNGLANSISGSSVTYAGGGGGGYNATTANGGTGGGGRGGQGPQGGTAPTAGTVNLGGGGGGGSNTSYVVNGASGGSGIVIIRYTIA